MLETVRAVDVKLNDLVTQFGLHLEKDPQFFAEWQSDLPIINLQERGELDRVQEAYYNLVDYAPPLEEIVKMAIISPLLHLAHFFLGPFYLESETPIRLTVENDGVVIEGKMDVLVLRNRLWILVIESKRATISLEAGLAQILVYMLANPNANQPLFGMLTNGGSFVFIKLVKTAHNAQYALSRIFEMRNPGNDLYTVLAVLKKLRQLVVEYR